MALKSTIYKISLNIANMDSHYYEQHNLTLARHPSETDERLMVRLVAFALYANDLLAFGEGIGDEGAPDLCQRDLTGAIELWIDVGLPDERRIRQACGKAKQVVVITYGRRGVEVWWQQNREVLSKKNNLTIFQLPTESTRELAAMVERTLQLGCTIEDGDIRISGDEVSVVLSPVKLL